MTQPPPIVPGPGEPQWEQPQQWPASPPPYQQGPYPPPQQYPQQQPVPVYQVQQRSDVVGKTMVGTITVIVTLVLVVCVLPMFLCVACGTLGNMTGGG